MSAFEASLARLRGWIDASDGRPIDFGEESHQAPSRFAFSRTPRPRDRPAAEAMVVAALPEPYARFVSAVGGCELFYGGPERRRGVRFLWPGEIGGWLDGLGAAGASGWLAVGANEDTGELFAFDLQRMDPPGAAPGTLPHPHARDPAFTAVWHEHGVEDWREVADELRSWTTFEDALVRLIASEGREPLS